MGRSLLVGIAYRDPAGRLLRQEQFCGTVTSVGDGVVRVARPDGEDTGGGPGAVVELPADDHAYDPAPRGRYVLASDGTVVEDPDYVTTWDVVEEG